MNAENLKNNRSLDFFRYFSVFLDILSDSLSVVLNIAISMSISTNRPNFYLKSRRHQPAAFVFQLSTPSIIIILRRYIKVVNSESIKTAYFEIPLNLLQLCQLLVHTLSRE